MASRNNRLNEIIFNYQPQGLYFQIKNENLRKYSVVPKKKLFGGPYSNTYIHMKYNRIYCFILFLLLYFIYFINLLSGVLFVVFVVLI